MSEYACCFTGHRPRNFPFAPDGLRPEMVRAAIRKQIIRLADEGYREFISGMCDGVDQWAAAEVLALQPDYPGMRLVAAIPFEGQESRWALPVQREYQRLLNGCDRVEVLYSADEARQDAAACYRGRNRFMVDHAQAVIAVFDPLENQRSGTASTVRYARQCQRRIVYIHPTTLDFSEEKVYQVQMFLE